MLNKEEKKKEEEAVKYVKEKSDIFIQSVLDSETSEYGKTAYFMAGTPGSGKTETVNNLKLFTTYPAIIDADNFREMFRDLGYDGKNSKIFQKAATLAVNKTLDYIFNGKGHSFILDSNFSHKEASKNIKRAIRHKYKNIQIFFIYQHPVIAWKFTKFREKTEGRHVPLDSFIDAYFQSRENIVNIQNEKQFKDFIKVNVIEKNYDNGTEKIYNDIEDIEEIAPVLYNKEELRKELEDVEVDF